jgi:transcription elongation GreA/GreB family factor
MNKLALLEDLKRQVAAEIDANTRRALDAAEAATHEENRAESDKDMRSTEASYVARGQAERVRELELARAALQSMVVRSFSDNEPIEASALVDLEHGQGVATYFLVPAAGGYTVHAGSESAQTLATRSPLGTALLGLSEGDDAEVKTGNGTRTYAVLRVR